MRIGIATDHGGLELKQQLAAYLRSSGHEIVDFGAFSLTPGDDYPDFVVPLAQAVSAGDARDVGPLAQLAGHAHHAGESTPWRDRPRQPRAHLVERHARRKDVSSRGEDLDQRVCGDGDRSRGHTSKIRTYVRFVCDGGHRRHRSQIAKWSAQGTISCACHKEQK